MDSHSCLLLRVVVIYLFADTSKLPASNPEGSMASRDAKKGAQNDQHADFDWAGYMTKVKVNIGSQPVYL